MQLIELSANQASFHTVNFNTTGVSIIRASQDESKKKSMGSTYNGVGKSLLIRLVHFCLGSNAIEEFRRKIPDWTFTLKFKINDEEYTVSRSVNEQSKIVINGKDSKPKDLITLLEKDVFELPENSKNLTGRSLLCRFVRPRKESYNRYDSFIPKERDHATLINNSFLLGLDIDSIQKKIRLKEELDKVDTTQKTLKNDQLFKKYFAGDGDIDIDIFDLSMKVKKYEDDRSRFKIAENYSEIKEDTEELSKKINKLKNDALLVKNKIRNIDACLQQKPDVAKKSVMEVYENTKVHFPPELIARIDEVTDFHDKLLKNRVKRLLDEKKKYEAKYKELESQREALGAKLDQNFEFLSTHGALSELETLDKKIAKLKAELEKLNTYTELLNGYQTRLDEIDTEFNSENIKAKQYLEQIKPTIWTENMKAFKDLAERFYEGKTIGITVKNNSGVNRTRFDITAKISDDTSDGIQEVKIFCFDMMLLLAGHNHQMKYVFHDSRILSDMDPRQRATLFKLANEMTDGNDFQYIISANEDILESMKDYLTDDEYKTLIEENVVLDLTDESPDSKLLGIEVDMDYEKKD